MSRITVALAVVLFSLFLILPAFAQNEDADDSGEKEKENIPVTHDEEVVVTGTRIKSDPQNLPADVTIIDKKRLQQPGVKNSMDALVDIPGVSVTPRQNNGAFGSLDVRGLRFEHTSGGNVLILLDGIPQRNLNFGGPYLGTLPYDAVIRMELAKGPTASLYGRNALAGALQLFTDPGSTTPHYDLLTAFEYPTISTRASAKGSGPIGKDLPHTYSITGSFTKAEGWQEDTKLVRGDLYLHTRFYPSPNDLLAITGGFYAGKQGNAAPVLLDEDGERLDGIDRDANLGIDDFNTLTNYEYRTSIAWSHYFGDWLETKLTGSYWHGDTYWVNGVGGNIPDEGSTLISRLSSEWTGYEDYYFSELALTFNYDAGNWLKGAVTAGGGYEYMTFKMNMYRYTTDDYVDENGEVDFSMGVPLDIATFKEPPRSTWVYGDRSARDTFETDYGVFIRDHTSFIDRIHITGGVRYDSYTRTQVDPATDEEAEKTDGAVSPSAGLSVGILNGESNRLNVYGAWGMGFSPVFQAITSTEFADVDPERSRSFEAGVKTSLLQHMIDVEAAGYQLERYDIVDLNPDSNMFENIGNYKIYGIEAGLKVRPIRQLLIFGNYTWREPTITEYEVDTSLEDNEIAGVSPQQAEGGIRGQADFGLGGGTSVRYYSEYYANADNTCTIPAYTLWDAYLSYTYDEMLEFSIYGNNLLDTEYMSAVYGNVGYFSGFEGTPRTFGAQVRAHF
ncbi:MAG: TonB-dependent receptor [Planctomycetia bacterium]|jgi:iron complex outermembrane receptor protein